MIHTKKLVRLFLLALVLIALFAVPASGAFVGYKIAHNPLIATNIYRMITGKKPLPPPLSDEQIINQIIADVPVLRSAEPVSQFDITNALREWVSEHVPVVLSYDNLRLVKVKNVTSPVEVPLAERLQLFANGEAGGWCSSASVTLMDIYELFGFESYELGFGAISNGEATHAVTLVRIRDGERDIWSVQDSYFNQTLVDRNGRPLDYFDVLDLLKKRADHQITIKKGNNPTRPRLIAKESTEATLSGTVFPNGNKIVYEEFRLPLFEQAALTFLQKQNLPANIVYLALYPYQLYGVNSARAHAILNRARAITGTWCKPDGECWAI